MSNIFTVVLNVVVSNKLTIMFQTLEEKENLSVSTATLGLISPTCLFEAFTCADPKSAKKTVKSSVSFCTFGSASVKAALETLMKSTPGGGSGGAGS